MGLTKKKQVIQIRGNCGDNTSVSVVQEVPFTIFLNGREVVTLLCTGHHLEELALGFLKSEGLLDSLDELSSLQVDEEAGIARASLRQESTLRQTLHMKRTLGSGCGRASLYYQPLDALQIQPIQQEIKISVSQIRARMQEMNRRSPLYRATRGTHNTALALADRILVSREDIGRHNAADMIMGHALRERIVLTDKMLLTTGRASSEIVIKAARVGIPILVSRSAPTHLGLEIAEKVGLTLVGYVRGGRMTIYTHPEGIDKVELDLHEASSDAEVLVKGIVQNP
jgi:FdhD protein